MYVRLSRLTHTDYFGEQASSLSYVASRKNVSVPVCSTLIGDGALVVLSVGTPDVRPATKVVNRSNHPTRPTKSAVYRFCVEMELLHASQIALTTFCRFVREYELLKDDPGENRRRLAFSMQYANQLWRADTMFGPHIGGRQAKLIALIDDASRVLCHGEFFFEENTDSIIMIMIMIKTLRSAFYKRGLPEQLYVDNGSIYCSQEITLICARAGGDGTGWRSTGLPDVRRKNSFIRPTSFASAISNAG